MSARLRLATGFKASFVEEDTDATSLICRQRKRVTATGEDSKPFASTIAIIAIARHFNGPKGWAGWRLVLSKYTHSE
ncbi:MAG: hypothetical protein IT423_04815 [Pirellulaceae bacterium]|nr:hypothetical protein [Pirellulaceae bacterium]